MSLRAPWWRLLLLAIAPFLFCFCPGRNYHWRWDRWCWCTTDNLRTSPHELRGPFVFWHGQDLNEDKRQWLNRRGWLHFGRGQAPTLSWQFCAPTDFLSLGLNLGGEDREVQLSIGCRLFSLWLALENILPRKWSGWSWPRATEISWHDGTLWLRFNADVDDRPLTLHIVDWLIGRREYRKVVNLLQPDAAIYFEAEDRFYPCTVELSRCTWTRRRWPRREVIDRAEVSFTTPVPIPGKGESSWDCGEDAVIRSTFAASTVTEALEHEKRSIEQRRLRYGGRNWIPEAART